MHELFRIRDGIWQIQEAHGVYFTIIKGSERAIVMDTSLPRLWSYFQGRIFQECR